GVPRGGGALRSGGEIPDRSRPVPHGSRIASGQTSLLFLIEEDAGEGHVSSLNPGPEPFNRGRPRSEAPAPAQIHRPGSTRGACTLRGIRRNGRTAERPRWRLAPRA